MLVLKVISRDLDISLPSSVSLLGIYQELCLAGYQAQDAPYLNPDLCNSPSFSIRTSIASHSFQLFQQPLLTQVLRSVPIA